MDGVLYIAAPVLRGHAIRVRAARAVVRALRRGAGSGAGGGSRGVAAAVNAIHRWLGEEAPLGGESK